MAEREGCAMAVLEREVQRQREMVWRAQLALAMGDDGGPVWCMTILDPRASGCRCQHVLFRQVTTA